MADINFILHRLREGKTADCFRLYACRGEGRGCPRNKYRTQKKPCDDCVPALDENETLENFKKRLERGDA